MVSILERRGRLSPGSTRLRSAALAMMTVSIAMRTSVAQMPGSPIFQNAWAGPGFVLAANLAVGTNGALYAVAGGWTPRSGSLQLSAGAGIQSTNAITRGSFGGRVAIPLGPPTSVLGFAVLAGIGGAGGAINGADTTNSIMQYPIGIAVGWRHPLSGHKAVSLFTTQSAMIINSVGTTTGAYRSALAGDLAFSTSFGITAGLEFGSDPQPGSGGPGLFIFALGATYAFGRK